MRLISLLIGVAGASLGSAVNGQGVTGQVGDLLGFPTQEQHEFHLGPGSVVIEPAGPTSVGNCIPFGNNTSYGFTGFIYRNVPPFVLTPGSWFAFDLGATNNTDIRRNIYFSVANINPAPPVIVGSNMVSQGVTATSWVKVATDTQIPVGSPGNSVCGDYELIYTAEAPFVFPGGGLIVGFGGSPPGAFPDGGCEQVLCQTTASDPSGFFYARFFFKPDQTLGILDVAPGFGGNAVALGGIMLSAGAADSDEDGVDDLADNCPETPNPNQTDGDGDGAGDVCDNCLDTPNSGQEDSDGDGVGDCCEPDAPDCNENGVPDACDIAHTTSEDCNGNGIPDECDISAGSSQDCDGNGTPDDCEEDCNGNGIADACDLAAGTSADCNGNDIPDECDLASGVSHDCQPNGLLDSCDIDLGHSQDCNVNGMPDECDIAAGTSDDCQPNGVPDDCEWAAYLSQDGQGGTAGLPTSSHCQPPDQWLHGGAYMVPIDLDVGTAAADSFTFAQATTITDLTWWGTYQDECGEPCGATDDFVLIFYVNNGGPASTVVATYGVGGGAARSATGQIIPMGPGFAEYEYSFDLVPPLSVVAGQRHWVEIRNNTGSSCVWAWETAPEGANGNGTSLYDADGDGYDDDDLAPYDLAFCVSGLPAAQDCNANGVPDSQDIFDETSQDCQPNGIPDECEDDRNYNGIPDTCDIVSGFSQDLNFNSVPDEADCLTTPGDLDGDCDVERDDYALFATCMGASGADLVAGCACADFDLNGTVDFDDYLAFSAAAGQPVVGCRVTLADACPDSWTTGGGGGGGGVAGVGANETFYDFGLYGPIPAGFFGEGSDPFGEVVAFVGTPADPNGVYGDMDTLIEHGLVTYDPETGVAQTTLDIIALDLMSTNPIIVTYNGGQNPEEWLAVAGLSPHFPPSGELTATLDDPDANSGTYDATVYVQPAFLFVNRQDLINHVLPECLTARVLDTGEAVPEGGGASASGSVSGVTTVMPPITLSFTGEPFVRVADPAILGQLDVSECAHGNFVPGVIEPSGGGAGGVAAAGQQLTCTSHITPGEAHYFCPPECEGEDVCKYSAVGSATPVCTGPGTGPGTCPCSKPPTFPQAVLGQPCPNGVGQCQPDVVKHRPCPGGGSAFQTYGNPSCISRESTCKGACCDGGCSLSTADLCSDYKGDGTRCLRITQQPQDTTVCPDGDATFTISAEGAGTLHYQWKKGIVAVGSDSSTLTLTSVQATDDGAQITCEVTDDCRTVTSNTATLTVIGLTSQTEATTPADRTRTTLGIAERVTVSTASGQVVTWSVSGGGIVSPASGASTVLTTSKTPSTSTVTGTVGGDSCDIVFTVIAPTSISSAKKADVGLGTSGPPNNKIGAYTTYDITVNPTTVSFYRSELRENIPTHTWTWPDGSSGGIGAQTPEWGVDQANTTVDQISSGPYTIGKIHDGTSYVDFNYVVIWKEEYKNQGSTWTQFVATESTNTEYRGADQKCRQTHMGAPGGWQGPWQ